MEIKYNEFEKIIEGQTERRDLEFKAPFTWKKMNKADRIQAETIKSIIAMSNTVGGGRIIIGIEEKEKKLY